MGKEDTAMIHFFGVWADPQAAALERWPRKSGLPTALLVEEIIRRKNRNTPNVAGSRPVIMDVSLRRKLLHAQNRFQLDRVDGVHCDCDRGDGDLLVRIA